MTKRTIAALMTIALLSSALWATGTVETAPSESKLSGKVVVYAPSPTGLADAIAEGFTAKTGVEVEMFQGTTGKINARLESEKANPVADVVIVASWPAGMKLKDDAMSYTPANLDKMNPGWIDSDSKLFGYSASAVSVIYNTTIFPTLDINDWEDLSAPAYRDQIVMPDPAASGSCADFISGYIYAYGDEGWNTIDALAANGLTVPGANKVSLAAVTTGEKGILLAGVDYNGFDSIAKGEPLGIFYPASGTVVNPRPAVILKTSKNVENAKAFIDYLLSDEAQKMVADAYLLPGRSDIVADKRSNISDIPQIDSDWDWMMAHSSEIIDTFTEKTSK